MTYENLKFAMDNLNVNQEIFIYMPSIYLPTLDGRYERFIVPKAFKKGNNTLDVMSYEALYDSDDITEIEMSIEYAQKLDDDILVHDSKKKLFDIYMNSDNPSAYELASDIAKELGDSGREHYALLKAIDKYKASNQSKMIDELQDRIDKIKYTNIIQI